METCALVPRPPRAHGALVVTKPSGEVSSTIGPHTLIDLFRTTTFINESVFPHCPAPRSVIIRFQLFQLIERCSLFDQTVALLFVLLDDIDSILSHGDRQ